MARLGVSGSVICRDHVREDPPHVWVEIVSPDSGLLIGERGAHLHALEHVFRLLIRDVLPSEYRCFLDVNAYRLRRMEVLRRLARDAARRAARFRHAVTLDPMPAAERRLVHLALVDEPQVETESIGEGTERRVVIRPRDPLLVAPESAAPVSDASSAPSPPAPS